MPRGVPKVRVPATSAGTCFICGAAVQVFSYGRKFGLAVAKCARCRQKGTRSQTEKRDRALVEKALARERKK